MLAVGGKKEDSGFFVLLLLQFFFFFFPPLSRFLSVWNRITCATHSLRRSFNADFYEHWLSLFLSHGGAPSAGGGGGGGKKRQLAVFLLFFFFALFRSDVFLWWWSGARSTPATDTTMTSPPPFSAPSILYGFFFFFSSFFYFFPFLSPQRRNVVENIQPDARQHAGATRPIVRGRTNFARSLSRFVSHAQKPKNQTNAHRRR